MAAEDDTGASEYSEATVYSQEYSEYVIKKTTLTAIADSVRAKTGKTDSLDPDDIPAEIESIIGVGITPTGTIDITVNGEHDVSTYEKANVNVPTPDGYYKSKPDTKTIATNGIYLAVRTDENGDKYFHERIQIEVPETTATGTIDITENGEHDVTAYAKANVHVPIPDGYFQASEEVLTVTENNKTVSSLVQTESGKFHKNMRIQIPEFPDYSGTVTSLGTASKKRTFIDNPDVSVDIEIPMYFYAGGLYFGGIAVNATTGAILFKQWNAGTDTLQNVVTVFADGTWIDEMYKSISIVRTAYSGSPNEGEYLGRGWLEANSTTDPIMTVTYNGTTKEFSPESEIVIACKDTVMRDNITVKTSY